MATKRCKKIITTTSSTSSIRLIIIIIISRLLVFTISCKGEEKPPHSDAGRVRAKVPYAAVGQSALPDESSLGARLWLADTAVWLGISEF
ncbi:molybdenum ABC transporter substrate-binding protein [Anopheles sinensis]|uniref:Molybdenum ABC transporter substrate-binding protein n=1 Tax=Anopheles sinensis TaxID=74873 RepID=A0A084WDW3_ANOSI|nr:molybdenum ABC transporter substrate-binding protein [Anopheles sinensis]